MATKTGIIVADFTTSLATALAIGATTATLQSATDDDGVALPTGKYYLSLDGANSSKEHIYCTLTGTALTDIKSISRQGAETTGVVRAHRLGATVTLTDFAYIKTINDLVTGAVDLDATDPLKYDAAPTLTTGSNELATVKYADDLAIAGSPNASTTTKGIVEIATQAEVDAKTATGGTGASLVATPALQRSTLLSDYVADSGSANAYVITPSPAITAYTTGQIFTFKATNANTTTSTVNVNGLGTKTIKKLSNTDLASGDIASGMIVQIEYDGTNFQMLNPIANAITGTDQLYFGDGSDGNVTISSNTTLTRDMFYNNLTIGNGFTLNTANYRVFVLGTLTNNNATNGITCNGGNGGNASSGTAGTAGTAIAAGSLAGGTSGASGVSVTGGASGGGGAGGGVLFVSAKTIAVQGGMQAIGGNAGTSNSAAAGGGTLAGSSATSITSTFITSGTGGNGGNGNGVGGSGGSIVTTKQSAKNLTSLLSMFDTSLALALRGGAGGGTGGVAPSIAGGSGGGMGGVIVNIYKTLTTSGTLTVTGGSGSAGAGGGTAGTNGSSGLAISLQIA